MSQSASAAAAELCTAVAARKNQIARLARRSTVKLASCARRCGPRLLAAAHRANRTLGQLGLARFIALSFASCKRRLQAARADAAPKLTVGSVEYGAGRSFATRTATTIFLLVFAIEQLQFAVFGERQKRLRDKRRRQSTKRLRRDIVSGLTRRLRWSIAPVVVVNCIQIVWALTNIHFVHHSLTLRFPYAQFFFVWFGRHFARLLAHLCVSFKNKTMSTFDSVQIFSVFDNAMQSEFCEGNKSVRSTQEKIAECLADSKLGRAALKYAVHKTVLQNMLEIDRKETIGVSKAVFDFLMQAVSVLKQVTSVRHGDAKDLSSKWIEAMQNRQKVDTLAADDLFRVALHDAAHDLSTKLCQLSLESVLQAAIDKGNSDVSKRQAMACVVGHWLRADSAEKALLPSAKKELWQVVCGIDLANDSISRQICLFEQLAAYVPVVSDICFFNACALILLSLAAADGQFDWLACESTFDKPLRVLRKEAMQKISLQKKAQSNIESISRKRISLSSRSVSSTASTSTKRAKTNATSEL